MDHTSDAKTTKDQSETVQIVATLYHKSPEMSIDKNTHYAEDTASDNSDNDEYEPRKVISTTIYDRNVLQQKHEVLSCPSTCSAISPKHTSTPAVERTTKPAYSTIERITNMTSEQLSKATDELNQDLYDKFRLIEDNRVTLNVGGTSFEMSTITLRYNPSSILAIATNIRYGYNGRRSIFIDQDPTYFHHVLNYPRNERVIDLQTLPNELGSLFQLKRLCVNPS